MRRRAREFHDFLKVIDDNVLKSLDIHIVMDNYATHKSADVKAWLAWRLHGLTHFTQTSASWLNQVGPWFAELTRKQLQRAVHRSTSQLEADIRAFSATPPRRTGPRSSANWPSSESAPPHALPRLEGRGHRHRLGRRRGAACKTLVAQRLKRSGMHWRVIGGQAVLTFRALIKSGPFDQA